MRGIVLALVLGSWQALAAAEFVTPGPATASATVAITAPVVEAVELGEAAELGSDAASPAESTAAQTEAQTEAETEALEVVATTHGRASFYAKRFHGRRTASGEPHDAEALTAAHRSLPFGTWVRVQSLHSGREVQVRINDRGPFIRGRVIDLSRAAAEALGMLEAGTHVVRVQVLGLPKP